MPFVHLLAAVSVSALAASPCAFLPDTAVLATEGSWYMDSSATNGSGRAFGGAAPDSEGSGEAHRLGVELLSYTGFRYSRDLEHGRASGAFLGAHTTYPDLSGSVFRAPSVYFFYDHPLTERWAVEMRLGTYGWTATVGAGAHYESPGRFYLNLVAEKSTRHFQLFGISIGWLWEVASLPFQNETGESARQAVLLGRVPA